MSKRAVAIAFNVALGTGYFLGGVAAAAPCVIYNPATGNLQFVNDTNDPLAAFYITSQSGNNFSTDRSKYVPIQGAILDLGDLPLGFTYLNFPVGSFNAGNVVLPGTPITDLRAQYYTSISPPTGPFDAVCIPEPAGAILAAVGLCACATLRRRAGLKI